jgi:hypothetical protein
MGDHIYVRLEANLGRHDLADAVGAARDHRAAMDVINWGGERCGWGRAAPIQQRFWPRMEVY